jgi:antitoxin ParD1/3/4
MSVTLAPRTEALIQQKIEVGPYRDADELIAEALRVLDARDRRVHRLRDSVQEGFAAAERGEGIELTAKSMAERIRRAEERARRGDTPSSDVSP